MKFESAHPDDFNEIQNLYWDLIDKVNKIHKHIANQRLDNLHKISTEVQYIRWLAWTMQDYLVDVIMKWIKKEYNDFKNQ